MSALARSSRGVPRGLPEARTGLAELAGRPRLSVTVRRKVEALLAAAG